MDKRIIEMAQQSFKLIQKYLFFEFYSVTMYKIHSFYKVNFHNNIIVKVYEITQR